jgi:replicative DNA helicase
METAERTLTAEDFLRKADRQLYDAASTLIAASNSGCRNEKINDLKERIAAMRREIYDTLSGRN